MKTIARNLTAAVAVGAIFSMTACSMNTQPPSDPSEAAEETAGEGESEKPKKTLEGMKGDKMEKADAEE